MAVSINLIKDSKFIVSLSVSDNPLANYIAFSAVAVANFSKE